MLPGLGSVGFVPRLFKATVMSSVPFCEIVNDMVCSGSFFIELGMGISTPLRAGMMIFLPSEVTPFFEIAGMPSWTITSFVVGVVYVAVDALSIIVSDGIGFIMPMFFANSNDASLNTSLFAAPV